MNKTIVINNDTMGQDNKELGAILIRSFLHTLTEAANKPQTIIFYNTGVKLVAEGSPVLDDLKLLQQAGVSLLACGTCLGYFELKEKIAVGQISNMYDISENLLASNVVTI